MTSGSTDEQVFVSGAAVNTDSGDADELWHNCGINEILNFEEFLEDIHEEAEKVKERGIFIVYDSYLFGVDRAGGTTEIDLLLVIRIMFTLIV